jgi:uncharacterized Zn finger protein (UPF0148 family)
MSVDDTYYCPRCGASLARADVCPTCGHKLSEHSADPPKRETDASPKKDDAATKLTSG